MSRQAFDEIIAPIVRQAREIYRTTGYRAKIELTIHADLFILVMAEAIHHRTPENLYDSVEIHNGVIIHCSQEGRLVK